MSTKLHVLQVNSLQAQVRIEAAGNPLDGAVLWIGLGHLDSVGVKSTDVKVGAVLEG